MAYRGGTVEVGEEAVPVCTVGVSGVIIQNLSSQPVTIGPAGVRFREGITLEPGERESVMGGYGAPGQLGEARPTLQLHAVVASGKGLVAYLKHDLGSS